LPSTTEVFNLHFGASQTLHPFLNRNQFLNSKNVECYTWYSSRLAK
jgi:hypothetical protein